MLVIKVMHSVPRIKTNQSLKAEKEPECSKRKLRFSCVFSSWSIQDMKLLESSILW